MRKSIVAGNWKLHGSQAFVNDLLGELTQSLSDLDQSAVDVVVCPPAIYIPQALAILEGRGIYVGAQNASDQQQGAYTGEIAPDFLADFGCQYVILGHSERREYYGETDDVIAAKVALAQSLNLTPILCIGETLAERDAGDTLQRVTHQLQAVIDVVSIQAMAKLVIAYEPIWAIGTGLTATPEQAQEVHQGIRQFLANHDAAVADAVQILYGGSVKADNAATLFGCPDIDGGLIGGASLKAADFAAICHAAS